MTDKVSEMVAFFEGENAHHSGEEIIANVYPKGSPEHFQWDRGWKFALNENAQT